MLPGSKITIESDATANIGGLNVYASNDWTDTAYYDAGPYIPYPTDKGDAILTVKGTLTVGTIGGDVYVAGGTVNATTKSITTYEAICISGSNILANLKNTATITNTYNEIHQ